MRGVRRRVKLGLRLPVARAFFSFLNYLIISARARRRRHGPRLHAEPRAAIRVEARIKSSLEAIALNVLYVS